MKEACQLFQDQNSNRTNFLYGMLDSNLGPLFYRLEPLAIRPKGWEWNSAVILMG